MQKLILRGLIQLYAYFVSKIVSASIYKLHDIHSHQKFSEAKAKKSCVESGVGALPIGGRTFWL